MWQKSFQLVSVAYVAVQLGLLLPSTQSWFYAHVEKQIRQKWVAKSVQSTCGVKAIRHCERRLSADPTRQHPFSVKNTTVEQL